MLITKETIAHYLLGRGLLTFDSVVDGDLLVVEATSRNRNFKVIRSASPGYFVKQVKTFEPQAVETMRYETACYWLSHNDPDFEPLRALMPKFYDSDPVRHALVIELLPEGGSLSDYHRQLGSFPVEVGVQLGRILGTYQREMGRRLREGAKSNAFARRVPWILSLHQLNQSRLDRLTGARQCGYYRADRTFTGRTAAINGFFSSGAGSAAILATGDPSGSTFKISERFIQEYKPDDMRCDNNFNVLASSLYQPGRRIYF